MYNRCVGYKIPCQDYSYSDDSIPITTTMVNLIATKSNCPENSCYKIVQGKYSINCYERDGYYPCNKFDIEIVVQQINANGIVK